MHTGADENASSHITGVSTDAVSGATVEGKAPKSACDDGGGKTDGQTKEETITTDAENGCSVGGAKVVDQFEGMTQEQRIRHMISMYVEHDENASRGANTEAAQEQSKASSNMPQTQSQIGKTKTGPDSESESTEKDVSLRGAHRDAGSVRDSNVSAQDANAQLKSESESEAAPPQDDATRVVTDSSHANREGECTCMRAYVCLCIYLQHESIYLQHESIYLQHESVYLQHESIYLQHEFIYLQHDLYDESCLKPKLLRCS
jgi:hypothetical protein